MEQAAAAASVREDAGRATFSLRAKERASEGGGGSRGAGALTKRRARGGHGRPHGGRRQRMAATGRRGSATVGRERARGQARMRETGQASLRGWAEAEAAAG
jgi:hypothetical protein